MKFNYAKSAATASRLLEKFGQTVELKKSIPGTYDPVDGASADPSETAATANAVLLDYSIQDSGARFADGSTVRIGDKDCIIEAGLFEVDESTYLTDSEGVVWQLEKVRKLAPAGQPTVIYRANARR